MFVALIAATLAALAPGPLAKVAIDQGIKQNDKTALTLVVILFLITALISWAGNAWQTYLVNWVGARALRDLRLEIFAHLQRLPVSFYEQNRTGVLISRITNDVEALDTLISDAVTTLFQSGLTLIGAAVIMLIADWKLAMNGIPSNS